MDQLNAPSIEGATEGDVAPLSDASVALFLDVDGTLLDLAARPDDVVTPAGLVTTLAGAEQKLAGALALISKSVSAQMLVVSIETWPSQARMVVLEARLIPCN